MTVIYPLMVSTLACNMVRIGAFNLCSATAYADDTDPEIQKKDRYKRLPNIQRDWPPAESLAMLKKCEGGQRWSKGIAFAHASPLIAQMVQCVTPLSIGFQPGNLNHGLITELAVRGTFTRPTTLLVPLLTLLRG